jgi:hypothetical protein
MTPANVVRSWDIELVEIVRVLVLRRRYILVQVVLHTHFASLTIALRIVVDLLPAVPNDRTAETYAGARACAGGGRGKSFTSWSVSRQKCVDTAPVSINGSIGVCWGKNKRSSER